MPTLVVAAVVTAVAIRMMGMLSFMASDPKQAKHAFLQEIQTTGEQWLETARQHQR